MSAAAGGAAKPPIFIVGMQRSGTTLAASILDTHSHISCGPETGFFTKLPPTRRRAIVEDPAWPNEAIRYLQSLHLLAGFIVDRYGLDEEALRAFLNDRTPSIQAVLEALTLTHAQRRGRIRWAEKSPTHLLRMRQIRELWPDAPIVYMVRDPRGVAASHLHVPWGHRTVVGAAHLWQRNDELTRGFLASDTKALIVKYEDVLTDAPGQTRRICAFIGEPFEEGMLDPERGRGTGTQAWKSSLLINPSRATGWLSELSEADQARIATIAAEGMGHHGYQGGIPARTVLLVQPYGRGISRARRLLEDAADRAIVLGPVMGRGGRQSRLPILFYGTPGTLRWKRRKDGRGLRAAARWTRTIVAGRLRGRTVLWVADETTRKQNRSAADRACDLLLRLTVRPTRREAALDRVATIATVVHAAPTKIPPRGTSAPDSGSGLG